MNRRKTKYLKIMIVVVVVTVAVLWVVLWASTPKQGTITNASAPKAQTTYYDKKLEGTYMSFQYSGKYIAKNEAVTNGDLERYTLSAVTNYDKRILASVADLPDGRLESNGAYMFRQKSSDLYTYRKVQVNSGMIGVWVKKDGTEQTAMIPRGNKVVVISFVTASTSDDLAKETDALLNTFRWKQ